MNYRALLRTLRPLAFLPAFVSDRGHLRLANGPWIRFWGKVVGITLGFLSWHCMMRSGSHIFMPAATFVSSLLRKGDAFFDVGAYDGLISIIAAYAVQETGSVHCFEPNPLPFEIMSRCIHAYGLRWVVPNLVALGDNDGRAAFYVPENPTGASLCASAANLSGPTTQTECELVTLDTYIRDRCQGCSPALVKIDVEGAELDVLRGGAELFSKPKRPMVVFEANGDKTKAFGRTVDEVMEWLAARGYKFYVLHYPYLVSVSKERDIHASDISAGPWTDVLALVPEIHRLRFESLRRRFRFRDTMEAVS